MPTYDYLCPANGRTVEVRHGMNEKISNWRELCALAGIDAGDTPESAEVQKLIGAGAVHTPKVGEWKKTGRKKPAHTHGPSCGCGH